MTPAEAAVSRLRELDTMPVLAAKPPGQRRIALLVRNPARDAAAAHTALEALAAAGYRTAGLPAESELADRLAALPSLSCPRALAEEHLSFADYSASFAALPPDLQRRVAERWGAGERDPLYRPGRLDCGRFALAALRRGNIAIVLDAEARTPATLAALLTEPDHAPPHARIALYAWLEHDFRADAIIDVAAANSE